MLSRATFVDTFQGRLFTSQQDKMLFSSLVSNLKHSQQQLQQGRVALQHLQRLLLAVASDDLGVTVLQQLLLPAVRERLAAVVATRAANLAAAKEAMQRFQALWELRESAAVLQAGLRAEEKHAAALRASSELLGHCLTLVKQFDKQLWADFGSTGLETVAQVGSWLMMQGSKVVAGLQLLEQQVGQSAADAEDSSSSSRGAGASSINGAHANAGSSSRSRDGMSASSGSSSSASGASASDSSSGPDAFDVLVTTTWGQCCELLLIMLEGHHRFFSNLPVAALLDAGEATVLQADLDLLSISSAESWCLWATTGCCHFTVFFLALVHSCAMFLSCCLVCPLHSHAHTVSTFEQHHIINLAVSCC
jgi:hypothetical protein